MRTAKKTTQENLKLEEVKKEADYWGDKSIWTFILVHGFVFLGFLFYKSFQNQKPAEDLAVAEHLVKNSVKSLYTEKPHLIFESLLLNLSSEKGASIAKLDLEMYVDSQNVADEIKVLEKKIRELVLMILSTKPLKTFSGARGLQQIQEQLKNQMNLFLTKGLILEIRFKNFKIV